METVVRWLSACLVLAALQTQAAVITVGQTAGYDFASIQSAIDAASSGDTITVAAGTYTEGTALYRGNSFRAGLNFEQKDNITLQAEGNAAVTVVDFDNARYGLMYDDSSGISVSGFTFRNSYLTPVSVFNGAGSRANNRLSYSVLDYRTGTNGYIQNYYDNMAYDHITYLGSGYQYTGLFEGCCAPAATTMTDSLIVDAQQILYSGGGLDVHLDHVNLFNVVNENSTTQTNETRLDPMFVNYAGGDFHIQNATLLTGASDGTFIGALGGTASVPAPAGIALLLLGLVGLRRRAQRQGGDH